MLYTFLIYVTFAVKIAFIISMISIRYMTAFDDASQNQTKLANTLTIRNQLDFVYIILMSIILIVNFNVLTGSSSSPNLKLDRETKALFFLYGIITLITAKYSAFHDNSFLYKYRKNHNKQTTNNGYLLSW